MCVEGRNYIYNVGDTINDLNILEKTIVKQKDKKCKDGKTTIKGYVVRCIYCKKVKIINEYNLKYGKSCICRKKRNFNLIYKFKVGDIINNRKIIAISRKFGNKSYMVQCMNDLYEYDIKERDLELNTSCPVCCNRICKKGFNDIATTHPQYVKYFKNIEDTYIYSFKSNKKVILKCPDCGYEKESRICDLSRRNKPTGCPICSDGISYPEKLIRNILKEMNVEVITELSSVNFKWCNTYKFDFYLNDYNCIIESHGMQHYEELGFGNRNLKEEQVNDKLKRELALKNGIKHYIVLDCRKSELEWIKNSIINSELPKILNFKENDINWNQCHVNSYNSLVIKSINLWNKGLSIKEIAEKVKLSTYTVWEYIKDGDKMGLCTYCFRHSSDYINPNKGKELSKETKQKLSNSLKGKVAWNKDKKTGVIPWNKGLNTGLKGSNNGNSSKIFCITTNKLFLSIIEACEKYNIKSSSNMVATINGRQKTCGKLEDGTKLMWRYATEEDLKEFNIINNDKVKSKSKNSISINGKKVICDNKIFSSVTEYSKYCCKNRSTITNWLTNKNPMPQQYIDLGLRYYNLEVDGDIEQYEQYIETKIS